MKTDISKTESWINHFMEPLKILICSAVVYLSPLIPFFILTGVVILVDTGYGIKVAKKNRNFKSRQFTRLLYKMFMYNIFIIGSYFIDKTLLQEFTFLFSSIEFLATKVVVITILVSEGISVDEKMIELNGKGFRYHIKRLLKVAKYLNQEKKEFLD